jgi:4-aminobutyrate aminotransferase-like enzyme
MATVQDAGNKPTDELLEYMIRLPKIGPVIVRGSGAEVEDEQGNRYLDFDGGPGVLSVGHCNPRVVAAVQKQAATLMQAPSRFHSRLAADLARRISGLTGGQLKKVYFSNSGAEANDSATKLAIKYAATKGKSNFGILSFEHGFHGRTCLPLAIGGIPANKKGFGPYGVFPGVVNVTPPYFYRCPYGSRTLEECGDRHVQLLRDAIKFRAPGEFVMMIGETILGVSGVLVPPDNYWPRVAEICAENGIALVMDEVFVGFGRTGKMFAHQHWGIKPSIVTFAKAIGGGLPLGGFIATEEIGNAFSNTDHNTTFGCNNQVGLAAGHAVLDVIEDERLCERAAVNGERVLEYFRQLHSKYGFVGDVRGKGMVLAIEVVKDKASKTPVPAVAKELQSQLSANGVMVGVSGVHGNVLRMSPPLTMTDDQIGDSLERFGRAFAAVAR